MSEEKIISSNNYPCKNCGAEMHYSPKDKGLLCKFCNTMEKVEEIKPLNIQEYLLAEYKETSSSQNETEIDYDLILHCNNCGAKIKIGSDEQSAFCPFCNSSHILKEEDNRKNIKAETIIPFRISLEEAQNNFKLWIKKRYFAPKKLKSMSKSEEIKGIYLPYWTYDSSTYTEYSANRGTYYYVEEEDTDSEGNTTTRQVRKTRWTRVTGNMNRYYNDAMVTGSNKHKGSLLDKADQFNLDNLISYDPKYLSGFMAESYSIDVIDAWENAKTIIHNYIENEIRREVGGDEFQLLNRNTQHKDISYKLFLLPMWISNYKFKGKLYQYLINGENGKVEGEYPKSYLKILSVILLFSAIIFAVYYFTKSQ